MSRLLAPADFGLVAMATVVTGFVGLFTDLNLSAATVQQRQIDQSTASALFFINVAMGFVSFLTACAAAPIAVWFFGDDRLLWVVLGIAATIPISAAAAQHAAILTRTMRWVTIQWTGILAQMVGLAVAVVIAAKTDLGYWALIASGWASAIVGAVLIWFVCAWRPSLVGSWRDAAPALHFGANLSGFNVVNYFHRQFDNVLIGWRWGPTDLGYYTRAYTLLTLPISMINGPLGSVVGPALSRLQHDPEKWRRAFLDSLAVAAFLGSGIATVLVTSASGVTTLVFGPGWEQTSTIFQYLAISIFAATPMNAMGWIYLSLGRTRRMFQWSLCYTPVLAVAFLVSVQFGVQALSITYACVTVAAMVPCLAYAAYDSPVSLRQMLRAVFPFISVGVAACLLPAISGPSYSLVTAILLGIGYLVSALAILLTDRTYSSLRGRVVALYKQY